MDGIVHTVFVAYSPDTPESVQLEVDRVVERAGCLVVHPDRSVEPEAYWQATGKLIARSIAVVADLTPHAHFGDTPCPDVQLEAAYAMWAVHRPTLPLAVVAQASDLPRAWQAQHLALVEATPTGLRQFCEFLAQWLDERIETVAAESGRAAPAPAPSPVGAPAPAGGGQLRTFSSREEGTLKSALRQRFLDSIREEIGLSDDDAADAAHVAVAAAVPDSSEAEERDLPDMRGANPRPLAEAPETADAVDPPSVSIAAARAAVPKTVVARRPAGKPAKAAKKKKVARSAPQAGTGAPEPSTTGPRFIDRKTNRVTSITDKGSVVGSRREAVSVLVNANLVSERHCRFIVLKDGVYVEDLGSAYGTFVNDVRVARRKKLADGDAVTLGRTPTHPKGARVFTYRGP